MSKTPTPSKKVELTPDTIRGEIAKLQHQKKYFEEQTRRTEGAIEAFVAMLQVAEGKVSVPQEAQNLQQSRAKKAGK